jgi:ribosomal protein S18 acetylase RimI-like enzyme
VRAARLDDPDVLEMIDEVQAEYRRRYGGPGDVAPIDPAQFRDGSGQFFVAELHGQVAGMGGWRRHDDLPHPADAEIKRMYVRPAHQRRGIARAVLAHLELTAAGAGVARLVLETGPAQPEAIALYRSAGYVDVESFGYYAGKGSTHLGKPLAGSSSRGSVYQVT